MRTSTRHGRCSILLLACSLFLTLAFLAGAMPPSAQAVSTDVVISEFRVRGPNGGNDEFVELYNLSSSAVNIGGWKINGSNASGTTGTRVTITTGVVLNPGCHYLVTNSSTTSGPYSGSVTGDQTYTTGFTDDGGIAVLNASSTVVDQVGMSTGSAYKEGTPLASLGSSSSSNLNRGYERKPGGASGSGTDTDNNSGDFQLLSPSDPQSRSSTCITIAGPTNPSGIGAANPATVFAGATTLLTVAVTPGANPISTGLAVTADLTAIGGSAPQTFYDDATHGDVTALDNIFSYLATVTSGTVPGAKSLPATITDAQSRTGSATIGLTVQPPLIHIHDIQGAAHISPLNGQLVSTSGIVTAKRSYGFWIQDPSPDADDATSEGLFVFTSSTPSVTVGDDVVVVGTAKEFRPGGSGGLTNLTTTEIDNPGRVVTVRSSGNTVPAPTAIGAGGRVPPASVIEDDATGDVETSGVFDPASDGIDFYESLEGMLVRVNDAVAVGPTEDFGSNREIPVLADGGAGASVRTARGGIVVRATGFDTTDFNPERIILNDAIGGPTLPPDANVGDGFPGAILGVIDYSFANFKLQVTTLPAISRGGLARETGPAGGGANQLAVAAFNVENLNPTDTVTKYTTLASFIVDNLRAPDLIAVEEIQDNNGTQNDTVVDASTTYGKLLQAIADAGGPTYVYRQIDPVDDQDGGAPGGNIRQAFLFRTDRGLSFVDRPGAGSTTANAVVAGPQLQYSPGRIDPTNAAFNASRKPLAGEFTFNGHRIFAVANHFNSKGGDEPLFGHAQPPVLASEVQRLQQAQVVHDFVAQILALDANASAIVLGDLNDFEFSPPVAALKGSPAILSDLIETLPQAERYTYVYEGNSETLDHTLLSAGLFARPRVYDVVHVNSEFYDQVSDHEPQVVLLTINDPPTVTAGGPYTVAEGSTVTVAATGSDPENGPLTYDWDLDNDGTFETPGQVATFSAAGLDGPSTRTIRVRATDNGGLMATAEATVQVLNVAPVLGALNGPAGRVVVGYTVTVSGTFVDPGVRDTFTAVCEWGDGTTTAGQIAYANGVGTVWCRHAYMAVGRYTVTITLTDDDGGVDSATYQWIEVYQPGFPVGGVLEPVDKGGLVAGLVTAHAAPGGLLVVAGMTLAAGRWLARRRQR